MHLNRRSPYGVLAALALALVAGGAVAGDEGPITMQQFDEALARAKAENKPVVLDFFTDW